MKHLFVLLLSILSCTLFASDERVLVVMQDAFLRRAIVQRLQMEGYSNVLEEGCGSKDFGPGYLAALFSEFQPDFVIVDGSKGDPLDCMIIDTQVVQQAASSRVKKTFVLSSFAVYPNNAPLPLKEESLVNLKIEKITEPYQIAKSRALKQIEELNGLKQPRYFFVVHPYLVGPHDTGFDIWAKDPVKNIAARVLKAKWKKLDFTVVSNNGKARYEIMHADDLADALVFLLSSEPDEAIINVSSGCDIPVKQLTEYVKSHLKFTGEVIYDPTAFDEVPRRVLDNRRCTNLGFTPQVNGQDAIKDTVLWLESQISKPYNPAEDTPFTLP